MKLALRYLSARWLTFGLKRPDAKDPPATPENTHATPLGCCKVREQCDHVPRADYYQLWAQGVSDDPDCRRTETSDEADRILKGLPVDATVRIEMRAMNEADPGPFGDDVEVVVN